MEEWKIGGLKWVHLTSLNYRGMVKVSVQLVLGFQCTSIDALLKRLSGIRMVNQIGGVFYGDVF